MLIEKSKGFREIILLNTFLCNATAYFFGFPDFFADLADWVSRRMCEKEGCHAGEESKNVLDRKGVGGAKSIIYMYKVSPVSTFS